MCQNLAVRQHCNFLPQCFGKKLQCWRTETDEFLYTTRRFVATTSMEDCHVVATLFVLAIVRAHQS